MPPDAPLNLVPTIQQAITLMLTTYEPEFIRFGASLFRSIATILIVWQGVRIMFTHDDLFDFAKLLLFLAFGFAMIVYYEAPIPGVGTSFSNLVTDQAHYFLSVLEARAFENVFRHLDDMSGRFLQPDPWSFLATLIYWTVFVVVLLAKAVSLAVIAYSLIASAVCALLGPIFVPFFVAPKLDWMFWGWLRSFIQYSFVPVVAMAFLMIFELFLYRCTTMIPKTITQADYVVYAPQVVVIIVTFGLGIVFAPSLTNSIFSGSSGETIVSQAALTRVFRQSGGSQQKR